MIEKFLLTFIIGIFMTSANAEPNSKFNGMYDKCLTEAGGLNNGNLTACSDGVSQTAKAEINALYRKIHEKLLSQSVSDATKFEQSQKAWVVYRNKHCELAGIYVGSPMFTYCPMQLNISRASELEVLLGE